MAKASPLPFTAEAERILSLKPAFRANKLGGYGPGSEVVYDGHPSGCPSVLVDTKGSATATFMSNGSVGLTVKLPEGMEVKVLEGHFDPVEKRETGVPSGNVWFSIKNGKRTMVASLINPNANLECRPESIKIVKLGDPDRAMWYCATFKPVGGAAFQSAVRLAMRQTEKGPILVRDVYIKNLGKKPLNGQVWTWYCLHGTQRFVYNKEIWYDCGYPVTNTELVMTARVPYSEIVQIKRLTSTVSGLKPVDATCDYSTFIGNTAAYSLFPQAVLDGKMLKGGAGKKINRFSTAAIGANQFALAAPKGGAAALRQTLLFVTDKGLCDTFRKEAGHKDPTYVSMDQAFSKASHNLIRATESALTFNETSPADKKPWPHFEVQLPAERPVSEYANSVWTGVKELYENCRAHGAKLADGIELGTRDRGQDMWPKMKEDPGRVRTDLVYVMGFMYQTHEGAFPTDRPLTLREKLHGMFPRQYPSRWDDRAKEVKNDNRPYTDSPLWLIDSLNMYLRETGDSSILFESVGTIKLTDADHPETSSILGASRKLPLVKVVEEVFACFERNANDSPYGMAQILYGDWCDPIDMFGTGIVGDAKTRGQGRGVQTRLSAHLFLAMVGTIDALECRKIAGELTTRNIPIDTSRLKRFADKLRQNIVKTAWEDGDNRFLAGFLNCIHELNLDGSRPGYKAGKIGYTLGSMKGLDFDGVNRRELAGQAYALEMLLTQRDWLTKVEKAEHITSRLLRTIDNLFYDKKLGLSMFTKPMANNADTIALAGRMGVLPVGTAENGEYHHCQVFMHRYRLSLPGQADTVWDQFKPMMSALRDETLCGPFETPCTSYVSDKDDPHFGKGMYFGLSGSVDWIVEIFHKIAGITFALHDTDKPAVSVSPSLPARLDKSMTFRRVIHCADSKGGYRLIPLELRMEKRGKGKSILETRYAVNGKPVEKPEVRTLTGLDHLTIEITTVTGK